MKIDIVTVAKTNRMANTVNVQFDALFVLSIIYLAFTYWVVCSLIPLRES